MENVLTQEQKEKEVLNEKAYSMHYNYPLKVKALMTLLTMLSIFIIMMFVYGGSVAWYLKAGVVFLYGFFLLKKFYDIKYYLGVKKNLFFIDLENQEFTYYNEFEGVKKFDLTKMTHLKIFRNKGGIHLIEIKTNDGNREQNINVQCLTQADIRDMVTFLRTNYPSIEYAENLPPYEVAKAQKEAEKQAKKEKYRKK